MGNRRLSVLVAAVVLALPAGALANQTIRAQPTIRYDNPNLTIDQGETVTFENDDLGPSHNVTATQSGPDGGPLFASSTIGPGQSAQVRGTEFLATGDYPFHCTIHPDQMTGTLRVTSNGTPLPRPDTTPPQAKLTLLTRTIETALRRRSLLAHVKSDEAFSAKLTARARGRQIASGSGSLGKAGFRPIKLRLSATGRRVLGKAKRRIRVSVRGSVVDRAGNRRSIKTTATLRRSH